MIRVTVSSDLDKLIAKIDNVRRDQLPFAIAKAVTMTAQIAKKRLEDDMPRAFDRPTPYTKGSLYLRSATKANPSAMVWLKDDAGKGTPAAKYLLPQIAGGSRPLKRMERALQITNKVSTRMYAMPGSAAQLDAYGNMNRGQVVKILSALGAGEVKAGYLANRTKASKKRKGKKAPEYFIGTPGGGRLPLGVYQRYTFSFGSAIKPVVIFTQNAPVYRQRYRFQEIASEVVQREFPGQFYAAYNAAVATAR